MQRCIVRLPWWNYITEQRTRFILMYGGSFSRNTHNARHRFYFKKYPRGQFPNRTRQHWNVCMTGLANQRPRKIPWPYDITSMIFNQPQQGSDKIGYVVSTSMLKTAVVAANHLVYYPKYNQRVARTGRYFAHDEDMACVEGDLVHVKLCRKISKYKHYYVFSILEPNIEGRERLKLGLRCVAPPLFGYPVSRRIVKLNLTSNQHTKQKLAAAIQEEVQEFYRFAGEVRESRSQPHENVTFDQANRMLAPNSSHPSEEKKSAEELSFGDVEHDSRPKKGEDYWMKLQPAAKYNFPSFSKSP